MDAHASHFSGEKFQSKAEARRQTTCTQDNNNPYPVGFVAAQENEAGISIDTIDVDTYTPNDAMQYPKMWIADLQLTLEDRKILYNSTLWLSDTLINAAQELLKRENSMVSGLQNVNLGMTKGFSIESGEFVQILHTGHGHWHVISTIGRAHPEIDIFDSMYCFCSDHSKIQIASILTTKESAIKLRYIDVQMQSGQSDCGIFAIAFATALVYGHHPGRHAFQQSAMRMHLLKCIENGKLTMFPVKKTRRIADKVKKIETVPVYCTCRMPQVPGQNWIQCSACKEWFHMGVCVEVDKLFVKQTKLKWYCSLCK